MLFNSPAEITPFIVLIIILLTFLFLHLNQRLPKVIEFRIRILKACHEWDRNYIKSGPKDLGESVVIEPKTQLSLLANIKSRFKKEDKEIREKMLNYYSGLSMYWFLYKGPSLNRMLFSFKSLNIEKWYTKKNIEKLSEFIN